MPFRRFHGRTGRIVGKQGECYYVEIRDGNSMKKVLAHPVHLKKAM
jgi:large subunit ribosomal protein L21e